MSRRLTVRITFGSALLAAAMGWPGVHRRYRADLAQAHQRIEGGGKIIDTACGPIQYAEFGEGAPMLMVHGAGGGYDQGEYFARLIGGDFRWIAPSRFGYLGTPMPDGAGSALQADAYAALLDALGIERVGVVGLSTGGPSSLAFALRYPQRTRSLALVSAASHALPPRSALTATILDIFLNDFVYWSIVNTSPQGLLVALGVPAGVQQALQPEEEAELHAFLRSIVPMGARRRGERLEQRPPEYDAGELRNIQAPALILHARDDKLVSFEHGEFAAGQIPGAELVPMQQGGHLALALNINAEAREQLRGFLEGHACP